MPEDCNHKIVDNDGSCIHCGLMVEEPGWIYAWATDFLEENYELLDRLDDEEE